MPEPNPKKKAAAKQVAFRSATASVSKSAANRLARKLQAFREGLPRGEKQALDRLLMTFADQAVSKPTGSGLLAIPNASEVVQETQRRVQDLRAKGGTQAITPTWTLTTLTTTIASHPIITCNVAPSFKAK